MAQQGLLPGVKRTIAISSGKGGVGKSTVAVNLAIGLARTGAKVGLMDADVYGPSVPTMLAEGGAGGGEKPQASEQNRLVPSDRHGIKCISMGLFTDQNTPVIWRGPMASRLIQQFLSDVDWGELDYLFIDMPPGTGDVQLTLVQTVPLTGAVVVTTPQQVAVGITTRGLRMFEQTHVPVVGIIENMSTFFCPHCEKKTEIFRHGGGEKAARELGFPFLGEIPLDPALAIAGDGGSPVVMEEGENRSVSARAFDAIIPEMVKRLDVLERAKSEAPTSGPGGGEESAKAAPKEVKGDGQNLIVVWQDGVESKLPFRELRFRCPCAVCVDEMSGERRITADSVAADVTPKDVRQVGRYAIQITWSDGHNTGIYSYSYLRQIAGEMTSASS